jgi:uncharacterized protein (DUF1330 family)
MSAYFVVELEITNPAAMEPYGAAVGATIEQYGGRSLAGGGEGEPIEGGLEPRHIVILEFPDKAAFGRWYDSPEHRKILPGRLDNSTGRAFIVEGMSRKDVEKDLSELLQEIDIKKTWQDVENLPANKRTAVLADLAALFPPEKKAVDQPDNSARYVPFEIVQLDYMQTGEQIKMLTDIRFKLLAFVPPIVGGGVTLLSSKAATTAGDQFLTGSVGLLGFALTLGVILYDLRNSQLYNAQMHRAKVLEGILGCIRSGKERLWPTPSTGGGKAYGTLQPPDKAETGGVHTQRAIALGSFCGQRIGHDPALSLVYGVALGAWVFPIVRGFGAGSIMTVRNNLPIISGNGVSTSVVALIAAIIAAYIGVRRINAHDRGWTATHLGYGESGPEWAKTYHDTIANKEIENKKEAEEPRFFKVTTRDGKPLGIKRTAKFILRRAKRQREGFNKSEYVICSTNLVRDKMRIFERMLVMAEIGPPPTRGAAAKNNDPAALPRTPLSAAVKVDDLAGPTLTPATPAKSNGPAGPDAA